MNTFSKRQTQIMKGIAILLLLICHSWPPVEQYQNGIWAKIVPVSISLSSLCRAIFAVLSGYGMYCSFVQRKRRDPEGNIRRFILSHILKIYTVFWLSAVIGIAVSTLIKGNFGEIYEGHPIYYALLDVMALSYLTGTPKFVNSWWYVTATLIYYILFPAFLWVIQRGKRANYCVLAALAAGIFIFNGLNPIPIYGCAFAIGMILAERDTLNHILNLFEKNRIQVCLKEAGLLLLTLLLCCLRQRFLAGTGREYYMDWLISTVLMLLVSEAVCHIKWKGPGILELTGRYSFEIYLLHAVILGQFGKYICNTSNCLIVLIKLLAASFLAALLIRFLENRIRMEKLSEWCRKAARKTVCTTAGLLAGIVLALALPVTAANMGFGDLTFLKKEIIVENGDWCVPLYLETPFLWDLAGKSYRSKDNEIVSFVDGVLYSHHAGQTEVTVSLPFGKSASCTVTVSEP